MTTSPVPARLTVGIVTPSLLNATAETDYQHAESDFQAAKIYGSTLSFRPYGGSIFIGGSGVTAATGLEVKDGEFFSQDIGPDEAWYAIATGSSVLVHVLQSGV